LPARVGPTCAWASFLGRRLFDSFPRHGFYVYDEDAAMVGTETASATMTGAADIATYVELFGALEDLAVSATTHGNTLRE